MSRIHPFEALAGSTRDPVTDHAAGDSSFDLTPDVRSEPGSLADQDGGRLDCTRAAGGSRDCATSSDRGAPSDSTSEGAHSPGCPACQPVEGEGPCGRCQERGVVACYGARTPAGAIRAAVLRRVLPSAVWRVGAWHYAAGLGMVGRSPAWTTEREARVAYRGEVAAIVAATTVH